MMDQFRTPMQHLKLYKMEAIFKALFKVLMLMTKAFLMGNFGLYAPGLLNFKMLVTEYHGLETGFYS